MQNANNLATAMAAPSAYVGPYENAVNKNGYIGKNEHGLLT